MNHRCFFGFSLDISPLTVVIVTDSNSKDEVLSTFLVLNL